MRRTASEVLRSLEMRVARLENRKTAYSKQAMNLQDLSDFTYDELQEREARMERKKLEQIRKLSKLLRRHRIVHNVNLDYNSISTKTSPEELASLFDGNWTARNETLYIPGFKEMFYVQKTRTGWEIFVEILLY